MQCSFRPVILFLWGLPSSGRRENLSEARACIAAGMVAVTGRNTVSGCAVVFAGMVRKPPPVQRSVVPVPVCFVSLVLL